MKYVNTGVVFQEIPDEVTLSINISGCPCHCIGCHSSYLWDDIGEKLNEDSLKVMLDEYGADITCVCFMGGDAEPEAVNRLAQWTKVHFPHLKIGWYSGRIELSASVDIANFDFIKLGPYVENKGGLNKRTTNQRMYHISPNPSDSSKYNMVDITERFWKK